MTSEDIVLKVKAVPNTDEDSIFEWKATCATYPGVEGLGNTPENAIDDFADEVRQLYTRGKFTLENKRPVEIQYKLTSATAAISVGVSPNMSLVEFGLETVEG